MAPDIVSVVALEPYLVRVTFNDGEIREVDIQPLLEGPVFRPLRDRAEFARVHIDKLSGAVAWPTGADLDSDVIYGMAPATHEPAARVTSPQTA